MENIRDKKDENKQPEEVKKNIDNFGGINNNTFDYESDIQIMTIIGSVEGHSVLPESNKTTKYENIIPQLVAVEENPKIKGLLVILNTVGGDVEAGLAMSEMISTMSKPVVSLVLGGGHSIGIPLAVSAKYSLIAESASMTLHPIRMTGLVIGAEPTYDYLRKMQERIIDFIVRNSSAEKQRITELMNATGEMANDVGTILYGREAVEAGLINECGGLSDALSALKKMIKKEGENEQEIQKDIGGKPG